MPRPRALHTPIESLMRWLAAWLAIALCAQAVSSGSGLLAATHRHTPLATEAKPMLTWRHAEVGWQREAAAAHARAHRDGAMHHHPLDDASLLSTGSDTAAAALAAFVAAPAPGGAVHVQAPPHLHHVWTSVALWTPTAQPATPLRHPPRV